MAWSKRGNRSRSENIPDEIVSEILSRLPLESIMVCKCVCKPWNSLINHNYFINLHVSKSNPNPSSSSSFPPSHILFETYWSSSSECSVRKLYLFNVKTGKAGELQGFPLAEDKTTMSITSSLNGLICFAPNSVWNNSVDPVVISNPLISGDYICLPKSANHSKSFCSVTIGFDNAINKYKVVRIFDDMKNGYPFCEVIIVGGKNTSWTRVKFQKGKSSMMTSEDWRYKWGNIYREGVYHQGSVYWMVRLHCTMFILELDLSREVFHTLNFIPHAAPNWSNYIRTNNNYFKARLQCLGEYLTLTEIEDDEMSTSLCVWQILKRKISGDYRSRVFGYRCITTEAPHSAEITDWIKLNDREDDFLFQTSGGGGGGLSSKNGKTISFYRQKKCLSNLESLFSGAQNVYGRYCFKPSLVSIKQKMLNDSSPILHP